MFLFKNTTNTIFVNDYYEGISKDWNNIATNDM